MTGVPLLAVKAKDYAIAKEKGRPHDHVPNRAFPMIMENEVENHSKTEEEAEQNWIEVTKADSQNIFMYYSRNGED